MFNLLFNSRRILKLWIAVIAIFVFSMNISFAATYYVDTNTDGDPNTCVAGETDNDDDCTFRDAVTQVSIGDTVRFLEDMIIGRGVLGNITVYSSNVTIEAKDNNGTARTVALNGNGSSNNGLEIAADGVTVDGLYIYGFDGGAYTPAIYSSHDNVTLENNVLGLRTDNSTVDENDVGIYINGGTGVTIDSNTISGNNNYGIQLAGDIQNISVTGNKIGTTPNGYVDKGNAGDGINIDPTNFTGTIGGSDTADRNIISGNGAKGINVDPDTTGSITIQNNYIGVGIDGITLLGNDSRGIEGGSSAVVTTFDWTVTDNVIAGSGSEGISIKSGDDVVVSGNDIGFAADGSAYPNAGYGLMVNGDTVTIGSNLDGVNDSNEENNIGNNIWSGIKINSGNYIQTLNIYGNYIGVHEGDATNTYGNVDKGISIDGSIPTINIGGVGPTQASDGRNVISNNGDEGIAVTAVGSGASIKIQNNIVGVNPQNNSSAPNVEDGVYIGATTPGTNATVLIGTDGNGTNDTSEGNTVNNNTGGGIAVEDGIASLTVAGNTVKNNGSSSEYGVLINGDDFSAVTIGGDSTAERNIIGSNVGSGVVVFDAGTAPADVTVRGNYVGVDSNGSTDIGNTGSGIAVSDGNAVTIKDNVVSNNDGINGAVYIAGGNSLVMQGNKIGTAANGLTAAGNAGSAVSISGASMTSVSIGTDGDNINDDTEGNVIAAVSGANYGLSIGSVNAGATLNIKGNYFGIAADGQTTTGLGNAKDAVVISDGQTVTFGGDNSLGVAGTGSLGEGNVVSNNGGGLRIEGNVITAYIYGNIFGLKKGAGGVYDTVASNAATNGAIALGGNSLSTVTIGGVGASVVSSRRNVISGTSTSGGSGVKIQTLANGATVNIKNNYIGTDWTGSTAVPNVDDAIDIVSNYTGSATINIGGTGSSEGNLISGNTDDGISFRSSLVGTLTAYIYQNIIGLNAGGTAALPNGESEIFINDSSTTSAFVIGSNASAGKNRINNSSHIAIYIENVVAAYISNLSTMDSDNTWTDTECPVTYHYWEQWLAGVLNDYRPASSYCATGGGGVLLGLVGGGAEQPPVTLEGEDDEEVQEDDGGESEGEITEEYEYPSTDVPEESEQDFPHESITTGGSVIKIKEVSEEKVIEKQRIVLEQAGGTVLNTVGGIFEEPPPSIEKFDIAVQNFEKSPEDNVCTKLEVDKEIERSPEAEIVVEAIASGFSTLPESEQNEALEAMESIVEESMQSELRDARRKDDDQILVYLGKEKYAEISRMTDISDIAEDVASGSLEKDEWMDINRDGLDLKVEVYLGLDPMKEDTDGDGLSDIEEVVWGGRPQIKDTCDTRAILTGFTRDFSKDLEGVVSGDSPLIKIAGLDPAESLSIWLFSTDDPYLPFLVAVTTVDEAAKATIIPGEKLLEGTYYIGVKDTHGNFRISSEFTVAPDRALNSPKFGISDNIAWLEFLGPASSSESIFQGKGFIGSLLECSAFMKASVIDASEAENLEIKSKQIMEDFAPSRIIKGTAEAGAMVFAIWKSVILSSVVLADADGEFEIETPENLPDGDHEILVFVYDPKKSLVSNVASLLFRK